MNNKKLPNTTTLSRLMADADRRIEDRHGPSRRSFSAFASLVSANVFVVTSCATAIAGMALIGFF